MKLLHTADWHLADRLGRIDRTDDLRRAVERIAQYCDQERIDVLLVAGDLFSELARPEGLRESVRHLQSTFESFLRNGGTILAITGNHDNENFCQTLRHAMTLAAPSVGAFGEVAPPGRLYLTSEPSLLRLRDPQTRGEVQFVLMPYPTPYRYLTNEALQRYSSFEQKVEHLRAAFSGRLQDIRNDARFDPRLPTVLTAHVSVRGAQATPLFRIRETDDIVFADPSLHDQFAYVALGHIHRPQAVGGHDNVRYCGSIDRLDLGEQHDSKGVIVVELGTNGLVTPPVTLPLDPTPIVALEIDDPGSELPLLAQRFPDHERMLATVHIHYTAGADSLEDILRQIDDVIPRWYSREWTERGAVGPTLTVGPAATSRSFQETVREYLTQELQVHEDRDAILALAENLMAELE